jgi:hypothetical protein
MSKRTVFDQAEIADPADFDNIGIFAQGAIDDLLNDAIGYPNHWAAFTVAQKSAQEVTVSPGRYLNGRIVYANDAPIDVSMQTYLPIVATDEVWVAIILRGSEETLSAQRTFETSQDPETSIPVNRSTPKTITRRVSLVIQQGNKSPAPAIKPVVAETDAVIAFVLLKSTGVTLIEPGEGSRAKTLFEVEGRVTALEIDLSALFERTATIETDIANIASRLGDIPRPAIIRQMQRDLGAARRLIALPDNQRAYAFDDGLITPKSETELFPCIWDTGHADWHARINHGIRFPFANERQAQLQIVNEDDPKIAITRGRRVLPAYDEVVRISNAGQGGTRNISQLEHTVVTTVRREVARERIVYGTSQLQCENAAGWAFLGDLRTGETFMKNDEEWVLGEVKQNQNWPGHHVYEITRIRRESYNEVYWDYETEEFGVNGSIYGQTFLAAQPMIISSIEVNFSRVGNDGTVYQFICGTDEIAQPLLEDVFSQGQIDQPDLALGWNRIDHHLTLIESGSRYGWWTVTTGNHALYTSEENAYTGGSLFYATDGAWAQGDAMGDFNFKVYTPRFRDVRTVIPLAPITLENGMTDIDLTYKSWVPGGTALQFEIKPSDADNWVPLREEALGTHPLVGLPAMVELRAVMIGTPDLAPMIVMDQFATVTTARNAGTMVAVSTEIEFGVSTTAIVTEFTLDAFDAADHTAAPKIMVAGATIAPDTTQITVDPNKPDRRRVTSTYALGAAATSARMRIEMSAANVVAVPFVQDCFIAAL